MKKSRFTEAQIIGALREQQAGGTTNEVCVAGTDQPAGLLSVEGEVWRARGVGRAEAEGAGGREPAAQEAPGGVDADGGAEGSAGKN
ncbi:MAG: hypothetical protein U1E59_12750 [Amaricoccus sp.]